MRYLHTMVRVTDIDASLRFYCDLLGLQEVRRMENEAGRFTLVFLAAPKDLDRSAAERSPEVELTFTVLGPALTRVAVEHRGWEALSDAQLGEDCARPGGYLGGAFVRGWEEILGRLTAAAETGAPDTD